MKGKVPIEPLLEKRRVAAAWKFAITIEMITKRQFQVICEFLCENESRLQNGYFIAICFHQLDFCPTSIKCSISNAQIKCLKCTKKKIFWIEYVNFHKIRAKSTKSFTRFTYNMATLSNALVQLFKLSVFYSVHLVKHIVMTVIM